MTDQHGDWEVAAAAADRIFSERLLPTDD